MNVRSFSAGSFAENGYLVTCGSDGTAVVVDPGAGAPEMLDVVREEDLVVTAILLTHAHLDHVEGVADIRAEWGDAPIHLHPSDRPLYDTAPEQAKRFGLDLTPPPPPDRELEDGQVLEFGDCRFRVRHTPGHAPGHVIFVARDEGMAFVGDVVFRGSIGRTDLPGGDFRKLMASIREHVLSLPDETRLLCGHGPETTVGDERVGNPFLTPNYGGEFA